MRRLFLGFVKHDIDLLILPVLASGVYSILTAYLGTMLGVVAAILFSVLLLIYLRHRAEKQHKDTRSKIEGLEIQVAELQEKVSSNEVSLQKLKERNKYLEDLNKARNRVVIDLVQLSFLSYDVFDILLNKSRIEFDLYDMCEMICRNCYDALQNIWLCQSSVCFIRIHEGVMQSSFEVVAYFDYNGCWSDPPKSLLSKDQAKRICDVNVLRSDYPRILCKMLVDDDCVSRSKSEQYSQYISVKISEDMLNGVLIVVANNGQWFTDRQENLQQIAKTIIQPYADSLNYVCMLHDFLTSSFMEQIVVSMESGDQDVERRFGF